MCIHWFEFRPLRAVFFIGSEIHLQNAPGMYADVKFYQD